MSLILSGTDGLSDVDGSAATPAIRGTDANTGIFFPAADTVGMSTGGSERVRVDSSGNVGIGTSSPAEKLDVSGNIRLTGSDTSVKFVNAGGYDFSIRANSGNNLEFYSPEFSASPMMVMTNSGNVGIGTASPTQKLDINNGRIALTEVYDIRWISSAGALRGSVSADSGSSLYFGTGASLTERMRIDSSGNVMMGVTSPLSSGKFSISFDGSTRQGQVLRTTIGTTGSTYIQFENSAGSTAGYIIHNGTTTVNYVTSSDYRLKEEITPMTGALAKVAQLKPVTYKWKVDGSDGEGFIAHELAEVCPIAVTRKKDEVDADGNPKYQGVDTSFLVATLTAAIKEQQALILSLTARITALETP